MSVRNWITAEQLARMMRSGWHEVNRQSVDGRTVVLLGNRAQRVETFRSLQDEQEGQLCLPV